ncbi:MAG: hypothetical protein Ct9H300mP15_28260 [Gemmatimonadota bacterium]|nr:MAG: hypothetical protein Ct9H300mP15_28260 [Gemmatimonadota bacterium]
MGTGPLLTNSFIGHRRKLIEEIRAKGINDLETLQYFDWCLATSLFRKCYGHVPMKSASPDWIGQTASQPFPPGILSPISFS